MNALSLIPVVKDDTIEFIVSTGFLIGTWDCLKGSPRGKASFLGDPKLRKIAKGRSKRSNFGTNQVLSSFPFPI